MLDFGILGFGNLGIKSFLIERKQHTKKRTSRIARKNASIFPPEAPLGGAVCKSTVPRMVHAR